MVLAVANDVAAAATAIDLALASRHRPDWPRIHPGVGWHPASTRLPTDGEMAAMERMILDPLAPFIGEVGLDETGPVGLAAQRALLERFIEIAAAHDRPLNLHLRGTDAMGWAVDRVAAAGVRAILHYFTGGPALVRTILDAGLWISVGRPVLRPENGPLREAVATTIPLDRLTIETDTYPLPGRTTEPADVVGVARGIADLRRCSVEAVRVATNAALLAAIGPSFVWTDPDGSAPP